MYLGFFKAAAVPAFIDEIEPKLSKAGDARPIKAKVAMAGRVTVLCPRLVRFDR